MKKTYIKDMAYDEEKRLITECTALRSDLIDYALEDAFYWIGEYLDKCPADYQFSGYNDELHLTYKIDDFEDWYNAVTKDYCLFSTAEEETIEKYIKYEKLIHRFDNEFITVKHKDYDYCYTQARILGGEVEQIIYDRMEDEINAAYDDDRLIDELDIYPAAEDGFVCDDDYSHVYRHVNGYYVPAHDEEIA